MLLNNLGAIVSDILYMHAFIAVVTSVMRDTSQV